MDKIKVKKELKRLIDESAQRAVCGQTEDKLESLQDLWALFWLTQAVDELVKREKDDVDI